MLTQESFRRWLAIRAESESLAQVGLSLGVSHTAVSRWLDGKRRPTKTVLLLAEMLMRSGVELPSGLPAEDSRGIGGQSAEDSQAVARPAEGERS